MGRELRMVPVGYEHETDYRGNFVPLKDGYRKRLEEFQQRIETHGLEEAIEWFGGAPVKSDFMLPDTPENERTMFMMFEDCSEGTPISPAFETIEELARWLADSKASAFGNRTATYQQWLATCKAGYAMSAVFDNRGLRSGVEACAEIDANAGR